MTLPKLVSSFSPSSSFCLSSCFLRRNTVRVRKETISSSSCGGVSYISEETLLPSSLLLAEFCLPSLKNFFFSSVEEDEDRENCMNKRGEEEEYRENCMNTRGEEEYSEKNNTANNCMKKQTR